MIRFHGNFLLLKEYVQFYITYIPHSSKITRTLNSPWCSEAGQRQICDEEHGAVRQKQQQDSVRRLRTTQTCGINCPRFWYPLGGPVPSWVALNVILHGVAERDAITESTLAQVLKVELSWLDTHQNVKRATTASVTKSWIIRMAYT